MLLCGTAAMAQILGVQHDDLHCCPSHSNAETKGFLCLRCGVYLEMAMVGNPVSDLVCICVQSHYRDASATILNLQILGVRHDDLHCCPFHSSAESKGFLCLLCRLLLENALVGNPLLFLYACVRSHYISATVLNLQAIGVQHDVQH